jgi:hypothetical protein
MKTAVEWFVERISHGGLVSKKQFNELLEQAKEMEKEQITLSHINGQSEFDTKEYRDYNKELANAYYNLTFKSE